MIILDIIVYGITLAIFVAPIYLVIKKISNKRSLEKENGNYAKKEKVKKVKIKKEKAVYKIDMSHIAGIDSIQKMQNCVIALFQDRINIVFKKDMEFNLKNENIKGMTVILAKDLLEKKKSPVLRGLVGNAIAGPGGLILGGMSGLNKSNKSEYVLIINYISKNEEEKSLIFGIKYGKSFAEDFIKRFEKINNRSMKINEEL